MATSATGGALATSAAAAGPAGATADAAVIERSLRQPEAFAELFERYADDIHRYVARRLGRETADDLLAETFAAAFGQRRRYDLSHPHARPWLYGIATNLIRDHRRAEARRLRALARTPEPDAHEPMADAVASQVSARAARRELSDALAALPARQRDVLLLFAWADLDYAEIATALGVPVGTVRSRLHRARRRLAEAVAAHDPDDEETRHG
ncbi:MAG TPA: sigma-70 family RNA polymerase sigma factor [Solirubrobacteraceae bacterium]|nr:sigma-70 family RNA polymerase sigma factor [Solirubrobacteraceae bacterium]